MVQGITQRRANSIPKTMDPNAALTNEVSNFQKRSLIITGGAFEFWTEKIATPRATKKATAKMTFIFPLSSAKNPQ